MKNMREHHAYRLLNNNLFATSRAWLTLLVIVLTAMVSACATPVEQSHTPPTKPPQIETGIFIPGNDGRLPMRAWLPLGEPKAVIVALHGFNDYSYAFEGPAKFFNTHNIAVYAYDQRGFGASESHGIWAGEDNLRTDLAQMVNVLSAQYKNIPLYILGESMGGAVVIIATASEEFPRDKVKGVILSAPALWGSDTMNPFYRLSLWVVAHTFPGQQFTGRDLRIQASDNIEMLRAMGRDPLIIKSTRVDAIYGIVQLMDSAYDDVQHVTLPTLMLYGAKDQVIPPMPITKAKDNINGPHVAAYYPDGYHMLLRDLRAQVVLRDIVSWIEHPNVPLPSGYDQHWPRKPRNPAIQSARRD